MSPQHEWGNTALTIACENGYATVAKVLLEHRAIVDHQNKVRYCCVKTLCTNMRGVYM